MKKTIFISFLVFSSLNILKSQDYTTALGLRFGYTNGISIKHFISSTSALEGLIAVDYLGNAYSLSGLYEIHANAFQVDGLNWFYGGGVSIGSTYKNFPFSLGIDGILGLEYKISEIPVNISLDIIPSIVFVGNVGLIPGSGLTVRYIFN